MIKKLVVETSDQARQKRVCVSVVVVVGSHIQCIALCN